MNTSLTDIKSHLQDLGIKSTIPRVVIYQSLIKSSHHPSAEEIYNAIQIKYPGVSLATVYKTLDLLVKNQLATKVVTDEDKVRYDPRTDQHIHLYCEKTGKITDHEDPKLARMLSNYFRKNEITGFSVNQIQVNIKGITTSTKKNK